MARLLTAIALCISLMLPQSVLGATAVMDASAWISTQFSEAKLRHPDRISRLVYHHAAVNDLPFHLLLAVIAVESSFVPNARSSHGAVGLTQVLPKYHKDKIKGRNLEKPEVAIEVGAIVLGNCLERWKQQDRALRCYSGSTGKHAVEYVNLVSRRMRQFTTFRVVQESQRTRIAMLPPSANHDTALSESSTH